MNPFSVQHEWARRYAQAGLRVLPLHTPLQGGTCSCGRSDCQSPGKHPRTQRGVDDATTDPATIDRWFGQWPDANVGIACGSETGIVVLDVDGEMGEQALLELGGGVPTRTAITGKGRHLYFQHPAWPVHSSVRLRPQLDVRGERCYVVAPPSLHASGAVYTWDTDLGMGFELVPAPLPPQLMAALRNGKAADVAGTGSALDPVAEVVDGEILPGTRNATMARIIGALLAGKPGLPLTAAIARAVNAARCRPPLDEAEVDQIVRSVAKSEARRSRAEAEARAVSEAPSQVNVDEQPIVGSEVLDAVCLQFRRFVHASQESLVALTLWAAYAHVHATEHCSPILAILSPTKRCGKTTTLEIIQRLVPNPLLASNASPASIFRVMDSMSPTLLLDEADTWLLSAPEFRGILNSGHRSEAAFVHRCEGNRHEPRAFSTWGPKAIALIGRLPDTLEDRSIIVHLQRRARSDGIERWAPHRERTQFELLTSQLAQFAAQARDRIALADPEPLDALDDRANENWRPLFATAEAAGGDWPVLARRAAAAFAKAAEDQDTATQLLADLRRVLGERERLETVEILRELTNLESSPWAEFGMPPRPLTAHSLGRLLKPFGIKPQRWRDGTTRRGYARRQFDDVWERYLPPIDTTDTSNPWSQDDELNEAPMP